MARKRSRLLKPYVMIFLLVGGLLAGWGLASFGSSLVPGWRSTGAGDDSQEPVFLARDAGPALALAESEEAISLNYLQQFCPDQPDLSSPGLCSLEPDQITPLAESIPPEALACWQQIYDYAFGPLANQPYLGGDPPALGSQASDGDPNQDDPTEIADCHQGAITVLVQPGFVSQIQADNSDAARFQDILFIVAAVIEYEAYRTSVPDHWSSLAGMVNFSYYQDADINPPGTWNAYPAKAGQILTLTEGEAGPGQIAVDTETKELTLPTTGRWGDSDEAGDPRILMIFHRADCTQEGSVSPVRLGGLRRYAVVYRPAGEDNFACHDF